MLAIAPVLAIHAGAPFMRGGGIGVDLFFTLSGFLITSLLLTDLRAYGSVRLRRFWLRRAARLAPALVIVVTAVLLVSLLAPGFGALNSTPLEAIAAVTYTANWTRALGIVPDGSLNHTWSLAIEEQYYLLWPLLLTVLVRAFPDQRRLAAVILVIACTLALWRAGLFLVGTDVDRLYNGTDTRADSLLIGSALAAMESRGLGVTWARWALWPALVVLVAIATSITCHAPVMYLAGYFIAPCCAAILISACHHPSWLTRFLSMGCMVWLGRISYSLYLWHVPVFAALRYMGFGGPVVITGGVAISIALAALSFHTVESYFMGLRSK